MMLFKKTPSLWIATIIAFAIFAFLVVPQPHASGQGDSGAGKATSTPTFDPSGDDSGDDFSPPTACISGGPTSGLAPLSVNFDSSCSGGNIVYYSWDMGNGTTSENPTASTTYHNPGTYTVSLTVCTPTFQCDSDSRTVTVNAPPPPTNTPPPPAPTACFNANPTSGNAPLHVNFSNCSGGNVVYYSWNFGDGGTSESPNPSHTYQNTGTYTATLTVCSPNTQCDSTSRTITVNAPPPPTSTPPPPVPTACFTAGPTSGIAPLYVDFDSSCSGGNIVQYFWDFGDGGTSESPNPSHTYQNIGTYTATLTVCSPNTQCDSTTRTITVHDTPTACFTPQTISGYTPLTVNFNSACSSANVVSYHWDFDDGNTSTTANPSHTYQTAGSYSPILTVCSQSNICRTASGTVVVSNPPVPTACFTAGPTFGYAPLTVHVDSSCSSASAVHYFWDFGNGNTSEAPTASTTYSNHGTYTITLTVCNQINQCDDAIETINVWELPPPTASFSYSPSNPDYGVPVTFINTTTPTAHLTRCLWDFGDGTTLDSCGTPNQERNVVHTYYDVGTFLVTLHVTNLSGSDTAIMEIYVGPPPPPIAGICATPREGQWPQDKRIIFNATECSGGHITYYEWDFGDGTTSTESDPIHEYNQGGAYTVTLTVSGYGGSDTDTVVIALEHPDPPSVEITKIDPEHGDIPYAQLPNNFFGEVDGYYEWFEWDFGDGTTSPEENPTHTFEMAGTYNVSFEAGHYNASEKVITTIIVDDLISPVARIDYEREKVPGGMLVSFKDISEGDLIYDWYWTFGDGNVSDEEEPHHIYVGSPPANQDHWDVTLTVTNQLNASDTTSVQIEYIPHVVQEIWECTISLGHTELPRPFTWAFERLPFIPIPDHQATLFMTVIDGQYPDILDEHLWEMENTLVGPYFNIERRDERSVYSGPQPGGDPPFVATGSTEWQLRLQFEVSKAEELGIAIPVIEGIGFTITEDKKFAYYVGYTGLSICPIPGIAEWVLLHQIPFNGLEEFVSEHPEYSDFMQ